MISEKINLEDCRSLSINRLLCEAKNHFKAQFVASQLNLLGYPVELTTTKTAFGGTRLWFICPSCGNRTSKLYIHKASSQLGCRRCLNLPYRKQSFKGMIEDQTLI